MTSGLFELAALIVLAAAFGVAARLLRQPIILAYLLTGAVVGYFGVFRMGEGQTFHIFGDLGIMFLLFLVGLEINYASLKLVGKTAALLGLSQIAISGLLGTGLGLMLGFETIPAIYFGLGLCFASTVVVVKLLSEKRDLGSLYGKISIGVLLIQDVVAILVLILLGGLATGDAGATASGPIWIGALIALAKGAFLFGLMLWLGRKVLPFVFDGVARSQELLFLLTLAWVFLVAAAVSSIGFSIEIAGLLAGLALANSSERFQIASRIRSLRDFFILIFFVILGSSLAEASFAGLWLPILAATLFVLVINPLVILIVMGLMGYRRRTSFFSAITLSQLSEFSLILAAVGVKLGHLSVEMVSIFTATAILTIIISSFMLTHIDGTYQHLSKFLRIFERANPKHEKRGNQRHEKPVVLIGAGRLGQSILHHLDPEDVLVIEFDPSAVEHLDKKGIEYVFGDISDPETFEEANLEAARLVICTSPDIHDSLFLLETVNLYGNRPKVVVRAESEADGAALYSAGADYVLLPHFTSGQYLGKSLAIDPQMKILESLRASDMEMMGKVE